MSPGRHVHEELTSKQLSSRTWPDFEKLFARHGGVWGGCWCMFFHSPVGFDASAYEKNRRAKKRLVREGKAHGSLVYCAGEPVGWCQFGPKEELPHIDRKRGYVQTDDGAWRITCLFIARDHRRSGVARAAVRDSVEAMRKMGIASVEAYPVEGTRSATLLWSGTPSLFEGFGFAKVRKLGKTSWIYSLALR
ncbi:MAG: GNAT family N-acetyltransferase [Nitrososphaerales archaeon]|nr:GNAT family N-acetyltransferase [Nitrososphaerales archaeon]